MDIESEKGLKFTKSFPKSKIMKDFSNGMKKTNMDPRNKQASEFFPGRLEPFS